MQTWHVVILSKAAAWTRNCRPPRTIVDAHVFACLQIRGVMTEVAALAASTGSTADVAVAEVLHVEELAGGWGGRGLGRSGVATARGLI